jgi:hypothetical protein
MNQHYFDVPFAFAGDVTPIPDPLQTGGTVSFTEGWNFNYQRDLSTDPAAEPIDRSTMNWLLLQITQALQAIQNAGVPEFITAAQNGGASFPYGKGTPVLWSASGNAPFGKYVSLTAGNTNTPDAGDPQGLTTGWQLVVDPIATAAQAAAGTDDASIMTPLKVAQQTALRALLAGNASQVFNVGPAVSATQAPQYSQLPGLIGDAVNLYCHVAAVSPSATWAADQVIVGSAIGGLLTLLSSINLTLNLATTGAGGMDTGTSPASANVAVYLIYNPTSGAKALLGQAMGAAFAPVCYGGTHMPAGFTQSALISSIKTTATGQFPVFHQANRRIGFIPQVVNLTNATAAWTALSVATVVTPNAIGISGTGVIGASAGGNLALSLAMNTATVGAKEILSSTSSTAQSLGFSFNDIRIDVKNTPQAIAFNFGSSAPISSETLQISEYEI